MHYNARVAASDVYPGDQLLDSCVAFEWNEQQKRHLGFSPFEVMFGTPVVTQAINYARGVMGPRAREPTAAERAELIECLQASAAATVAACCNATRRATAVALNQQGRGSMPDLAPGDKVMFSQPVSGGLSRAKNRSRKLVSTFAGPATVLGQLSNVGYLLQGIATTTDIGLPYARCTRHRLRRTMLRHRDGVRGMVFLQSLTGQQRYGDALPGHDVDGAAE